jgi:hypothetical protein
MSSGGQFAMSPDSVGRIHLFIGVFVPQGRTGIRHLRPHLPAAMWDEFTSFLTGIV